MYPPFPFARGSAPACPPLQGFAGKGGADVDAGVRDGVVQSEGEKTTEKTSEVAAAKIGKARRPSYPGHRADVDVGDRDGGVQTEGEKTTANVIGVAAAKIGKARRPLLPGLLCLSLIVQFIELIANTP